MGIISAGIVVISQAAAAPAVNTAKPLVTATSAAQAQDKSKARPTSSISAVTRYDNDQSALRSSISASQLSG